MMSFLFRDFNCFEFLFCFRKYNQVVHILAKWVVVCDCDKIWLTSQPNLLEDVIVADTLRFIN